MDVRKSALESELVRCEKELKMLGSQTVHGGLPFNAFLTSIVDTLKMVCDTIPRGSVIDRIAASLLYDSIKDAVSVLKGCNIIEHTDWKKGLYAVNNVSLFANGIRELDEIAHEHFPAIRQVICETLLVDFDYASSIPTTGTDREKFICDKLRELGGRLDLLGENPEYYDFLGRTSKHHMISLINILKQ